MLAELMHRLQHRASRLGQARRTEICPPALLRGAAHAASSWRSGLRDWRVTGWQVPVRDAALSGNAGVRRVRDEFVLSLHDIRTQQSGMLQERIRIARSLRELWHLRPEVFKLVALRFSQAEAQARLDRLNRHFPTRSPRSGFAQLDGASGAAGPRRPPARRG